LANAIAGKVEITARQCSVLGDLTVAELQALMTENHIVGIKALLDYDLKILAAKEIGINRDNLTIGDLLFLQANRGNGIDGSEGR